MLRCIVSIQLQYMYVYMYVYIYMYTYIYICLYTHTQEEYQFFTGGWCIGLLILLQRAADARDRLLGAAETTVATHLGDHGDHGDH